jgi:hypothetical protein
MSQRVVSESVSDEDTAAAAEAVVVWRNSILEIVDIENCPPKRIASLLGAGFQKANQ